MRLACPEDPGVPLHVVQRGPSACFPVARDCIAYLEALREAAAGERCAVHAYALMSNHVHLLFTPSRAGGATRLMRAAADGYGRHLAEAHGFEGELWEQGFDATPVHARRYFFHCMRYIEANPVRARLVREPGDYRWSSWRANALGEDDALVAPHPWYCALGRSRGERCTTYRAGSAQLLSLR